MLSVVKPSPLRLWGFLLTVLGGALLAFGSLGSWAAISLGNSVENAVPTKGVDVWQGKATLVLGVLIIIGILVLRFVRPEQRRTVAVAITVLGAVALGLSAWCVVSLDRVVGDTGIAAVMKAAEQAGMSTTQANQLVTKLLDRYGIQATAQTGLWISIAGAALALAGGVVDLLWVRKKAQAGDAIDPDTLAESAVGPPAET